MVDFSGGKTVITDEAINKVSLLAEQQLSLEQELVTLEEIMNQRKEQLRKVQEYDLPEAMAECGISEFKLQNGFKITVKNYYSGKIKPEQVDDCHKWLRDNGFEALIKHNLTIDLGKGQDDLAEPVKDFLKTLGLSFADKEGVHHSTLNAFLKEQVEGGNTSLPHDLFNVFVGRKAKISTK